MYKVSFKFFQLFWSYALDKEVETDNQTYKKVWLLLVYASFRGHKTQHTSLYFSNNYLFKTYVKQKLYTGLRWLPHQR